MPAHWGKALCTRLAVQPCGGWNQLPTSLSGHLRRVTLKVLPMYRLFSVRKISGRLFWCGEKRGGRNTEWKSRSSEKKERRERRKGEENEAVFIFRVAMGVRGKPQSFSLVILSLKKMNWQGGYITSAHRRKNVIDLKNIVRNIASVWGLKLWSSLEKVKCSGEILYIPLGSPTPFTITLYWMLVSFRTLMVLKNIEHSVWQPSHFYHYSDCIEGDT